MFLHCQDSVNKDSNLAGGKDVPLWGWIQKAEKLQRIDDLETQSDEESPDAVIESLKKEFESLEWTDPGHKKLEVRLKGRASNMLFQISGRDTKIGAIYDCISVGASKENQALSKALRERKSQLNLRYLLVCDEQLFVTNLTNATGDACIIYQLSNRTMQEMLQIVGQNRQLASREETRAKAQRHDWSNSKVDIIPSGLPMNSIRRVF